MASISIIRFLIDCDGCNAIFGDRMGFESLTEARAAAYAAGWRFPNQLTSQGAASARTSDVCPGCLNAWLPEQCGKTGHRQRVLSRSEMEQLPSATTPPQETT